MARIFEYIKRIDGMVGPLALGYMTMPSMFYEILTVIFDGFSEALINTDQLKI